MTFRLYLCASSILLSMFLLTHESSASQNENPARSLSIQIASQMKHLKIHQPRIERVANILSENHYTMMAPTWNYPPYPDASYTFQEVFTFFLVLNSINFQYFDDAHQTYSHNGMIGAGLVVQRMTESKDRVLNPEFLSNITEAQVNEIFWGDIPIPAAKERAQALQEVGSFLAKHKDTQWLTWLSQFPRALDVAVAISKEIPSYNDPFLKRAQLFVGMVVGRYKGEPDFPDGLKDTSQMTIYADYILPMILIRSGILEPSSTLEQMILAQENINADSQEEKEIRAATVLACDSLLKELHQYQLFKGASILALDAALWLQAKEVFVPNADMPRAVFKREWPHHHRTKTIWY